MSMPESPKKVHMYVRDRHNENNPWSVDNFHDRGWKVRSEDNSKWIVMGPENVRIRNPEHDPDVHDANDPDYPLWLQPEITEE